MRSSLSRVLSLILLLLTVLLTACGSTQTATPSVPTPTVAVDAYGTPITFPNTPPQRIISLLPSTSEILGALHLDKRVVAVDYYTNYPTSLAALPKISDANVKYDVEKIVSLHPDLILTYAQETKTYDQQFKSLGLREVALPLSNFTQSLQEILLVGRLTGTQDVATKLYNQLQQQMQQIESTVKGTAAPKTMIELDDSTPGKPFVFGGTSYGDDILHDANGINVFHSNTSGQGYPEVADEAVISANPAYILLTENPQYGGGGPAAVYKRPNWGSIDAVKMQHVYYVNGDIMSRPGPRLIEALQCVAQLIHPDKFSGALPAYCS